MSERRIVEYVTPFDGGPSRLDDQVNSRIKDGWQPYGSPLMEGSWYCQPMVRYAEPEPEAADERAKIVAWLRSKQFLIPNDFGDIVADYIEVGEHLK